MQQRIRIDGESQIGAARREAATASRAAALPDTEAGRVAIVVSELARNLVNHARGGDLYVQVLEDGQRTGVEVLSIDRGPGMDVERALRDGFSTGGTRGEGLGAVRRLSHEFDAWSSPQGSVLVSRVWTSAAAEPALQVGAICQPIESEQRCGDAWAASFDGGALRLLLADGLGHGPMAARASGEAVQLFEHARGESGPEAVARRLHEGLRGTRGAAVGVAQLDPARSTLRFAGIGNIAGVLEGTGKPRGLVSHAGIAGHEARRVQEFSVEWERSALLVLHSDGLATHWRLERYEGLRARHAAVIAGILFRDFRRKSDDTTVVVVKEP